MIEPNELRIGNIVNWQPEEDGFNFEATIEEIKRDGISIRSIAGNTTTDYSKISGIPLDPDWLERCGFDKRKQDEDGEYWGILNFTLIYGRTDVGGFGWFLNGYHNDCHLLYLHQLQNLFFALKSIELEIKPL